MPDPAPIAPSPEAAASEAALAAAVQTPTSGQPDFYQSLKSLMEQQNPPSEGKEKPPEEPTPPTEPLSTPEPEPKKDEILKAGEKTTAPEKTAEKPPEKTPDKPAGPAKAVNPKELRDELRRIKEEKEKLSAELTKFKTAKPAEDPEKAQLIEFAKRAQQQIEKLTEVLRYNAYEQTDEYKEKYQKPYVNAYNLGRTKTSTLRVVERTNDEGTVTQQPRAATPGDFDAIMRISDDADAAERAEQLFGAAGKIVLYHRERVQEHAQQANDAIGEFRKTGSERHKEAEQQRALRNAYQAQQWQATANRFHELNAEAEKMYPQWFGEVEGDEAGNEALRKGKQFADMAFSDPSNVEAHSAARMRAAAFDRLVLQLSQSRTKISELEKELASLKGAEPGGGTAKRMTPKAKTFDDLVDEVAARNG